LLVDTTPLSLGIETVGKVISLWIKRNTAIPVRKTRVYTTQQDYKTSVDVCIYEGERACVDAEVVQIAMNLKQQRYNILTYES